MGISTGRLCSLKLSLRQILFSPSYCTLPSFKSRGAGYECVVYGINNTRSIDPNSQKEHIEINNILKFVVYRAYIERDRAIQNLQNF